MGKMASIGKKKNKQAEAIAKQDNQGKTPGMIQSVINAMKKNILSNIYVTEPALDQICTVESAVKVIDFIVNDRVQKDGGQFVSFNEARDDFHRSQPNKVTHCNIAFNFLDNKRYCLTISGGQVIIKENSVTDANKPGNVISITEAPSVQNSQALKVVSKKIGPEVGATYSMIEGFFQSKYNIDFAKQSPKLSKDPEAQEKIFNIWNNKDFSRFDKEWWVLGVLEMQGERFVLEKDEPNQVATPFVVSSDDVRPHKKSAVDEVFAAVQHDVSRFIKIYLALSIPVIATYGLTLGLSQMVVMFGIILPAFSGWLGGKLGWKTSNLH